MIASLGRARIVVPATLLACALVLLAAGRTWFRSQAPGVGEVAASGSEVAPALVALALAAAAASLAAATSGRLGRRIALVIDAAAGLAIAVAAVAAVADAAAVLGRLAANHQGQSTAVAVTVTGSIWPTLAVVAGLGIALLGIVGLAGSPRWLGLSSRHDREPTSTEADQPAATARSDWDRISAGEDPTLDEST